MTTTNHALLERRLHLFTGKGGVGKSTLVAAIGLALARAGRRPLIVELGHRASIEHILAVPEVRYKPARVAEGLHAMNMDLHASIAEYVRDHLKVRALGSLALRSSTLRRFFEAAPGVAEVAVLHKLRSLLSQEGVDGFDPILVDLDSTGHARMFFELPRVFAQVAESGPIRTLLDRVSAVLRDPGLTALHIVTIASELPMQETLELYRDLRGDPAVELGALIVNAMPIAPFADATAAEVLSASPDSPYAADLSLARRALLESRRAQEISQRLAEEVALPMVKLPKLTRRTLSRSDLVELGEALVLGISSAEVRR